MGASREERRRRRSRHHLDIIVVALSDRAYDYFVRAIVPSGQTQELVELLEPIEPLPNVALVSVLASAHAYLAS